VVFGVAEPSGSNLLSSRGQIEPRQFATRERGPGIRTIDVCTEDQTVLSLRKNAVPGARRPGQAPSALDGRSSVDAATSNSALPDHGTPAGGLPGSSRPSIHSTTGVIPSD